jgi:hypothetical protein
MSCRCLLDKWQRDLQKQRELAQKAAVMEQCIYVVYENNGKYNFCKESTFSDNLGELVEYITYL